MTKEEQKAFEDAYRRCYGFPEVGMGSPNVGPCYRVALDMWEEALEYAKKTVTQA